MSNNQKQTHLNPICPICKGPANDNPFSCILNPEHNFSINKSINGINKRKKETKEFIKEWCL